MIARRWISHGVFAALLSALTVVDNAQSQVRDSIIVVGEIKGALPRLDGELTDSAWLHAAVIPLTYQWFPDDAAAAVVDTECRVTSTKLALFIGCTALDPAPQEIIGILRDRDAGDLDDGITIVLDPFGDGHEAFAFRVSASGVLSDAQLGRVTGTDYKWDAVWEGRSRRQTDGYTVEVAIPFSSIRTPGGTVPHTSRLLIDRFYPRRHAYRFAATRLDRAKNCRTCEGIALVLPAIQRGGRGVLLQPTLVAADQRDGDERLSQIDVGGALRWQAMPSTRISATVNPDFSQVEADELDFEINRRFVLTYDERRPFFLEGREMLEGYGNLVFSRRIVDPRWGFRALNRESTRSAAVLVTQEESDTRIEPGPFGSSAIVGTGGATTSVARFRLMPERQIAFGGLLTLREATLARNGVAAVDADVQLADRHRLRLVSAFAVSRYDDDSVRTAPTGAMGQARYDLSTRTWGVELSLRAISPDFRADAGLLQRVNLWGPEVQIRRMFWGNERSWYSLITATVDAEYFQTFGSQLVDGKTAASLTWQGPRQTRFGVELRNRRSAIDTIVYDHFQFQINAGIRGYRRWHADAQLRHGEEPDVENSRLGRISGGRVAVAVAPYDAFNVTAVARYEQLRAGATWVYRATIGDLRAEFYPRLNTRIRIIAQRSASQRNPAGGVVDGPAHRTRLTFQALGSQRFGTRALVFIGYVGSGSLLESAPRWPQGRSVFAKVAWDLAF